MVYSINHLISKKDLIKEIAADCKRWRLSKRYYSMDLIANACGVSEATISRFEAGKTASLVPLVGYMLNGYNLDIQFIINNYLINMEEVITDA